MSERKISPEILDETQGQVAYHRLLDEIRNGELVPGARLRETELSDRLGISRTPVREALRNLEADGLIDHAPRQGAVVKTLTYQEVVELYEMRAVLEATAARMASRHASDIEIEELEDLNNRMSECSNDGPALFRLNKQFHTTLLNAAKNRYLIKSMNAMSKTLLILGPSTLVESTRASKAIKEHWQIIDAIRNRNLDASELAMRAHIKSAQRIRLRVLRDEDRFVDINAAS